MLAANANPMMAESFLLRRLATEAIKDRDLPDVMTSDVLPKWLLGASQALHEVTSAADKLTEDDRRDQVRLDSLVDRQLQAQYHDQMG